MKPKLSVVVPVYNSSGTLHRCVESLQKQTLPSLEIILVDDGSTDTSGAICDSFASKDERIRVIHQENKGVLIARVVGCKDSHGEYISFVDSDDWVDENMFEALCSTMKDVDMVASGVYRSSFDGSAMGCILNKCKEGYYDLTDEKFLDGLFFSKEYLYKGYPGAILVGMWGKIYRREIVLALVDCLSVRIREGEDFLFNVLYLIHCNKVKIVADCYYHYSANINSVTYTRNLNFLTEQNLIYKIIRKEIAGHPAEKMLIKQIQKRFMYNVISEIGRKMEFDEDALLPKWHFPQNDFLLDKKIVLFGAGSIGQAYIIDWKKRGVNVVRWVDNVPGKVKLFGMIPETPKVITNVDFDYVVCGVKSERAFESMKEQMLGMGIDEQKILWDKPIYTWIEYLCN